MNFELQSSAWAAARPGDHDKRRSQQLATDWRHSGSLTPYTRASFSLSRREFAGLRAGAGESGVAMRLTWVKRRPRAAASWKMVSAKSAQVASPEPVI